MKKTKKMKRPATSGAWVFKNIFLASLLIPITAHSFEYQDYEKKIKNSYSLRNLIEKMPRKDIEETLRAFVASGRPSRLAGTPGHARAREYLEKKLQSFNASGTSFYRQEFNESAVNLVWEKKGAMKPDDVIILGANYDTLLKDPKTNRPVLKGEMPGADNNASGVSILLSMIEILNKLELPKTVRIVFFDKEEFNAQGSKEFAKKTASEIGGQKIVGVINLTMLAHDSKTTDKEKKLNNMNLYARAVDQGLASLITENGKRNYSALDFSIKESTSSDFPETAQSFWAVGLPAVTLTQNRESDPNPRYMTSNDFVETLNINTYTNVFKYVTSAVLAWNYDIVK